MNDIKTLFLVLIFTAISAGFACADAEFWSANTIQFPLAEKTKLNIIPELRFRNNASELYYFQTYIGPAFLLSRNFELDAYYALNFSKNGGSWSGRSLGYLDGIYKATLPWFSFANRGRFEYDIMPGILKYRNLFGFSSGGWFAGDEFFYNFNKNFIDEGRSSINYSFKVSSNTGLSLGYLLRRQKQAAGDDWTRTSVITGNIKVGL